MRVGIKYDQVQDDAVMKLDSLLSDAVPWPNRKRLEYNPAVILEGRVSFTLKPSLRDELVGFMEV